MASSNLGLGHGWLSLIVSSSSGAPDGGCLHVLDTVQARTFAILCDGQQAVAAAPKASHAPQTYASPNVEMVSELAASSRKNKCLFSTASYSSLTQPRPHPHYICSASSSRIDTLNHYISSRMRLSSAASAPPVPSRIIRAHDPSVPFPSDFQTLSPAPPNTPLLPTFWPSPPNASSTLHHVVVIGDSIDAFFHWRNRRELAHAVAAVLHPHHILW